MLVWLTRKENKSVLDKQLQEQLRKEKEYYHNVLKRVIAVVKFLSIRGLAFRGSEEVFGSPHNGNFMGAMELLAEFDPFIREHIEQREHIFEIQEGPEELKMDLTSYSRARRGIRTKSRALVPYNLKRQRPSAAGRLSGAHAARLFA
ncbi:hypothetical protein EVAR_66447_1 [Eumeta japonica]|uniref:DUF4371 domain-containing protein n=1 Tax=Eumeta variegata TaxID=151549 RepID=A0A4C2A022_EUMVA|nr:hypothetical protein EVAR_66447_1 [Eumeta japonica]